jgi:alcohol dehydrogenase class IV
MRYNALHGSSNPAILKKQEWIQGILWSEPSVAKVFEDAGLDERSDLGDLLDVIIRKLELPRTLKEVGVEKSQIEALAKRTLDDAWAATNPVPLAKAEQVVEILEAVAG